MIIVYITLFLHLEIVKDFFLKTRCVYIITKQDKRLIATRGEYWIPTTINYISLGLSNDNRDTQTRAMNCNFPNLFQFCIEHFLLLFPLTQFFDIYPFLRFSVGFDVDYVLNLIRIWKWACGRRLKNFDMIPDFRIVRF